MRVGDRRGRVNSERNVKHGVLTLRGRVKRKFNISTAGWVCCNNTSSIPAQTLMPATIAISQIDYYMLKLYNSIPLADTTSRKVYKNN